MLAPPPPPSLRLWPFLLLAFVGTWGSAGLFWLADPMARSGATPGPVTMAASYVAVWAPSAAALFLAWRGGGGSGLFRLLRRLWRWPGTIWLFSAAAIPLGAEALGALLGAWIGPYAFRPLSELGPGALLMFVGTTLVAGPLGEEFGWRGLGLDRATLHFGPRRGAVVIALAWTLWHMPAFLVPNLQQLIFPTGLSALEFGAFTLTGGIIAAWLTNRAQGALGPAIIFHLCLLAMLLAVSERPPSSLTWSTAAMFALVALVILIREPTLGRGAR